MPLPIRVQEQELYDEETKEFYYIEKPYNLILEHSLISISKWESRWHKPFPYINENMKMTLDESNDYIRCMTINNDVPDLVYKALPNTEIAKINAYINDPMSATTVKIHNQDRSGKKDILTSELLYYFMFKLGIPKECERWHINRLIKLIEIYSVKENTGDNKLSRSELVARNKAINARNRAKMHSKG